MNKPIETIKDGIFTLEIFPDEYSESPMTWVRPVELLETRQSLEGLGAREIIAEYGNIWYSQIKSQGRGYAYVIARKQDWVTALKAGEEKAAYHGWDPTKKGMQAMVDNMAKIMQQYFEGDIYGYVISVKGEKKDSCCGFFGMDDAMSNGREAIETYKAQEAKAEQFEKVGMAK